MDLLIAPLLERAQGLEHWQIALLATGLLLQGAVFTVFPEEVIIATLGYLWASGRISFLEGMFAAQLGLLPANAIMVFVGGRFGPRLVAKRRSVQAAAERVRRFGRGIAFVARFTPTIRAPLYLALGSSGIRVRQFTPIDAFASCIHVPLLMLVGRDLALNTGSSADLYAKLGLFLGVWLGLAALSAWFFLRQEKSSSL